MLSVWPNTKINALAICPASVLLKAVLSVDAIN